MNNSDQEPIFPCNKLSVVRIIAIGRHPEILATVVRLINNNQAWHATGCLTDEEAIATFDLQQCTLILLGGGIEPESEQKLCAYFIDRKPEIKIVQHYGGGSGLLTAEIYEALK